MFRDSQLFDDFGHCLERTRTLEQLSELHFHKAIQPGGSQLLRDLQLLSDAGIGSRSIQLIEQLRDPGKQIVRGRRAEVRREARASSP